MPLILNKPLRQLVFLLCLATIQQSVAQPSKNAIINFGFAIVNNRAFKSPLWDSTHTASLHYLDKNDSLRAVNTMDTILSYTIHRLEEQFNIEIAPLELGEYHLNASRFYVRSPKKSIREASDLNLYNNMFEITFIINTYNKSNIPVSAHLNIPVNPNAKLLMKVEHYDGSGKKFNTYKFKQDLPYLIKYQEKDATAIKLTGYRLFELYENALEEALLVDED